MTAVEWLVEELEMIENSYYSDSTDYIDMRKNSIELAKLMEKEQCYSEEEVAIAFNEGQAYSVTGKLVDGKDWVKTHKKEWFEQFKKK